MSRFFHSPLLVFLVMGFGLFLLMRGWAPAIDRGDRADDPERTISVSRQALLDYVQLRTGEADPVSVAARFDALEAEARQVWVERFAREEALVREARRLGLDRNDDLIRRRLVQQMEFLAAGAPIAPITEADLATLYEASAHEHRVPRVLSFAHVFVADSEAISRGPKGAAFDRARALRDELVRERTLFEFSGGRGDRFLYHRAYIDRTEDEVRAHFGPELAEALGTLEVEGTRWQGPLASQHGWHVVLLIRNDAPRVPELEEIRDDLLAQERRVRQDARREEGIRALLDRYQVVDGSRSEPLAPSGQAQ